MNVAFPSLLTLLLAGCATEIPASAPARPLVPDYLRACPPAPAIPLPPRKPRTIDSISAWGNENDIALRQTREVLTDCDARRAAAVKLLLETQ